LTASTSRTFRAGAEGGEELARKKEREAEKLAEFKARAEARSKKEMTAAESRCCVLARFQRMMLNFPNAYSRPARHGASVSKLDLAPV
jgi:hypothetical protein